jgi:uncharacterized protein YciI
MTYSKLFIFVIVCIVFSSCSRKLFLRNENLFLGIYKLNPYYTDSTKWTKNTYSIIQKHVIFLDSLGNEGVLLFAGRTKYHIEHNDLTGIMILKYNKGLDSLKVIMKNDPAIINNVQTQEIHPYSMGVQHFQNLGNN